MANDSLPRLLKARELSGMTGIPRHRIYELARSRAIPHVRLGRAIRFDPNAVRDWIAAGGTRTDPDQS